MSKFLEAIETLKKWIEEVVMIEESKSQESVKKKKDQSKEEKWRNKC